MWRRPYRSIDFGEREWTYPLTAKTRRRTTATATTAKPAERFRSLRKNNTYKSGFEKASQSDYASFSRLGFLDFALFGLHAMSSVEELLDLGRMHAKKEDVESRLKSMQIDCDECCAKILTLDASTCANDASQVHGCIVSSEKRRFAESCCKNACNWSAAKCHSTIRCKQKGSCWQYCCTIRIVGYKLDEIFWWRPCARHCQIVWQGNWKWRWWTGKGYVNSPPQSFSDREQKELELAISESHRTKAEHDSRTARSSSAGFHLFISRDVCMPQALTADLFLHWSETPCALAADGDGYASPTWIADGDGYASILKSIAMWFHWRHFSPRNKSLEALWNDSSGCIFVAEKQFSKWVLDSFILMK